MRKLISEISLNYSNKAVGIKFYTEIDSRVEDFTSIGFVLGGITEKIPRTNSYFYLKNTDFNITSNIQNKVITVTEKIDKFHSIILNKIDKINKARNIQTFEEKNFIFVALDSNNFVGGVHGCVSEDSMYINCTTNLLD